METRNLVKLRQTTTGVQIRKRREMRNKNRNSADIELITGDGRFRRAQSSEWDSRQEDFHTGVSSRSCMQTLDKRISASIDQLDTLRERREAPRFRSSHKIFREETDINQNDVVFKYKGENYSKNQYFFGDSKKQEKETRKTPFEMFLEDDGPYSRKLFGPVPSSVPNLSVSHTDTRERFVMKNLINRTRDSRDEDDERGRADKIVEDRIGRDERVGQEERVGVSDPQQAVRKGVLWQQRDRLFSRWKERYIVLTRDYLHCFKRVTNRSSEMGDFIFKVKLVQLEGVTLIDKRGYLTVCLCILREGRIYLRSAQGIRDWFQAIQSTVYDSKRRRKFWVKDPAIPPGCTPCSLWTEKKEVHEKREEKWKDGIRKDVEEIKQTTPNQIIPKGINRLSLVTDLLMSEAITSITRKDLEDSGHDSGQSSLNTESSSESEKSAQKWINKTSENETKKISRSGILMETFTSSRV